MDEITKLKALVALYQKHHVNCCVILPESRASLDQALHTFNATSKRIHVETSSLDGYQEEEVSPESQNTVFIPFVPSDPPRKKRKTQRSSVGSSALVQAKTSSRWYAASQHFVRDAPTTEEWKKKLEQSPIKSPTVEPTTQLLQLQDSHAESAAVKRGMDLAHQTASYIKTASDTGAQARMFLFLFLSYCVAMEKLDILRFDDIKKMMTEVLTDLDPVSITDAFAKRVLSAAEWFNSSLIAGLVEAGWTRSGATHLFFFSGPRRLYLYDRIYQPESLVYIVNELSKPSHKFPSRTIDDGFSAPGSILSWEPDFTLEKVSKALGYPTEEVLTSNFPVFEKEVATIRERGQEGIVTEEVGTVNLQSEHEGKAENYIAVESSSQMIVCGSGGNCTGEKPPHQVVSPDLGYFTVTQDENWSNTISHTDMDLLLEDWDMEFYRVSSR